MNISKKKNLFLKTNMKGFKKGCLIAIFAITMIFSFKNSQADSSYYSATTVPTMQTMAPMYQTSMPIMTDTTWLLTPYLTVNYIIGSANIKTLVDNYNKSLKAIETGLSLSTGFLINKSYGLGISFFVIRGINKDVIDNDYVSKTRANMYIINVDTKIILPFTFHNRLHFYVIGGIGAVFTASNYDFKRDLIPSSFINKATQMVMNANIGGGIEFNLTERFLLNAEFRKFFILKSKAISDFWLLSFGLTVRF